MSTLNKLPRVIPDVVRTDDDWEDWEMEQFLYSIQKWLRRNKVDEPKESGDQKKRESHWYAQQGGAEAPQAQKEGVPAAFIVNSHTGVMIMSAKSLTQ